MKSGLKKALVLIMTFVVLASVFVPGVSAAATTPIFSFKTTKGEIFNNTACLGKTVVLLFGRPACGNTQAGINSINSLRTQYSDNVIFLTAFVDNAYADAAYRNGVIANYPNLKFAYNDNPVSYTDHYNYVMWDFLRAAGITDNTTPFPVIVILNPKGEIVQVSRGYIDKAAFQSLIDNALPKLTMKTANSTLNIGEKLYLKVNSSGISRDNITWKNNNPKVLSVSSNGVVTAKTSGSATVYAKYGNSTVKVFIRVKPAVVLKMYTANQTVSVGTRVYIKVGSNPSGLSRSNITWKSSNPAVLSVSSNGVVTAKSAGSATIYATYKESTVKCFIRVR